METPLVPRATVTGLFARHTASRWRLLTLLSLVLLALVPLSGVTPHGTLQPGYTDHVRHPYVVWVGLHRGIEALYTASLGELREGIAYRQSLEQWLDVPYVYPPGTLVLFLPLALVGQWVPLSPQAFAQVCLLYLLVFAHGALYAVLRLLDGLPAGGRWAVGGLCWLVLMRLALNGQYDGAWLVCGVLALGALAKERPVTALRWVALAALLHYRAFVLAAVGVVALAQVVRGKPVREWPWATLLGVAAVGVVCVRTFLWMAPLAAQTDAATPSILGEPGTVAVVLGLSVAVFALAGRGADGLVAASVGLGTVLAFIDTRHWWHASALLLVPLAVGVTRPARWPTAVRLGLVVWAAVLEMAVWHGSPLWLFRDLNRFLRMV
ncbi:hypothetical protein [Corallococcus sicarius]|uniref:DUF2029 domain-containing protein n=1 Tax=Corallococcus sicarius TaxID=2316726 RepID=A0A3A8P514_9BACT|nr:hypothetical protein [Corallococcus sicarius]RKH46844.1 hypothetical protein D7X12_04410 [Corallococcus sicarius]